MIKKVVMKIRDMIIRAVIILNKQSIVKDFLCLMEKLYQEDMEYPR